MDERVRVARLADHGHPGGQLRHRSAGWRSEKSRLPEGVQRIDAPTSHVWIIGRTKTDGPPDYDAVHKIQAGYRITPLSRWGKAPEPVEVKIDPSVDMKTPPKVQVDSMPAGAYFAYAAEIMKLQPPHITDQPIVALVLHVVPTWCGPDLRSPTATVRATTWTRRPRRAGAWEGDFMPPWQWRSSRR